MLKSSEQFTSFLEYALSQPPSAAGLKVKSYRALSKEFNLSHSLVKTSLTQLEKKGIILRRHGSGTYVRRVPTSPIIDLQDKAPYMEAAAKKIFKNISLKHEKITHKSKLTQIGLKLGIVGVTRSNNPLMNQILQSIANETGKYGHSLSTHFVDTQKNENENLRLLDSFISNTECEGFLVNGQYGGPELEIIKSINAPVLYFLAGRLVVGHEPIVMIDTADAVEKAVVKFYEKGFRKISLIGIESSSRLYGRYDTFAYEKALDRCDLDYRSVNLVKSRPLDLKDSIKVMDDVIESSQRPQCVIVSDDNLMPGITQSLEKHNMVPGRDIGIIILSNKGIPLPQGYNWSRFEFNPEYFGKTLVDNLLWLMQNASSEMENLNILARWRKGETDS